MPSLFRNFSHIYIEQDAMEYATTQKILERFPKSEIISIDCYKEVFNRNQQNFRTQKASQKILLAKRNSEFLYTGSHVVPSFGHDAVYYNTLVLNCIYDCEYCYLQGMFPSSHLVVFVNNEDFISETETKLQTGKPLYLCLSYDTDLLAVESLLGYCERWIEFTRAYPNATIEIRTKSAAIETLRNVTPHDGVILAWTLSPSSIAKQFEKSTPSPQARIAAIEKAVEMGWNVRICCDPVLPYGEWERDYTELFQSLFSSIAPDAISELSLGSFRIGEQYFKKLKKIHPLSPLVHQELHSIGGTYSLPKQQEHDMLHTVYEKAAKYLPKEKIDILTLS